MHAEDIKGWLRNMKREEEGGNASTGDRWRIFVKLIHAIWENRSVPQQMLWTIVFLLPKGGSDYPGIGLIDPFWKSIEVFMDDRFKILDNFICSSISLNRFLFLFLCNS